MRLRTRTGGGVLTGAIATFAALTMALAPAATAAQPGIAGPQWNLQNAAAQPAYFQISGDQLSGAGPCNTINARAVVQDDRITFDTVVTTRAACHGAEAQAEQQLFRALSEGQAQYRLNGNTLTLTRDSGTTAFVAR
ncbi:META domain-containing protein [Austwickia chelonae]|uniref:META domain-containing protein n=1 Tax=Austwickia chelonae TaxID=100225 RepID=UPI000E25D110|nr:META domain-containing protein [Austwickia chelonae]